jgi:hypothetical protein
MIVRDNWYEDSFQGLNCELWEKATSPEWTTQEVDFLLQHSRKLFGLSNIEYIQGMKREEYVFKHYVFTLGEIVRLLQEQGLEWVAAYSSTKKRAVQSWRCSGVYRCTKAIFISENARKYE